MRDSVALQRYLQRHIEAGLPSSPGSGPRWRNVLVIPAYRESPDLLQRLTRLPPGSGQTLVILILNRPDSDPDVQANASLLAALDQRVAGCAARDAPLLYTLNHHSDLYAYDMDTLAGPIPAAQGVGLARKLGCDIALKWMSEGAIRGDWICSTDADALLPQDYFRRLERVNPRAVAAVYPFWHIPGADHSCNAATALYELRLHHHVLGLEYAESPYACHALGSCLAVKSSAYAKVRGFPKRAGGEDFYLLNKLVKLGPRASMAGDCIELQSRHSRRVPFGTGPAVAKIAAADAPEALPLFYHPACFEALRALLSAMPSLWQQAATELPRQLAAQGLEESLARACRETLRSMGLEDALAHCQRQGKTPEQFLRQFHQWFDAFRTLKFIHAIRDAGWPEQPLAALETLAPQLLPAADQGPWQVHRLRVAAALHWGWSRNNSAHW